MHEILMQDCQGEILFSGKAVLQIIQECTHFESWTGKTGIKIGLLIGYLDLYKKINPTKIKSITRNYEEFLIVSECRIRSITNKLFRYDFAVEKVITL